MLSLSDPITNRIIMISLTQILTWIGISPAAVRNAIINDLLSNGLEDLKDLTHDEVKDTLSSYAKRNDGPFPVVLTPLQKQRLRGLVLLIKDISRSGQEIGFNDHFDRNSFLDEISEAITRDDMRNKLRKIGEAFLDTSFTHKLKGQVQWKKFIEGLSSNLSMIVGVQDVPLSYVIRKDPEPHWDPTIPYEDAIIQGVKMEGPGFMIDKRTVHQIILRNVCENSDAYTYLKPLLRRQDGSLDIKALRDRYESEASRQTNINLSKSVLANLKYKNERSLSFESFSSKLQKAYDDLEDAGRHVHNGDIVDALWSKIQASELQSYIASLKVDYQRNVRNYKVILQDIASEVASGKQYSEMKGSSTSISVVHTNIGPCPAKGVHTADGSLYIGKYDQEKWIHDSVVPYHKEIYQARKKSKYNGGYKNNSKKRQLDKINKKIKAAKVKLEKVTGGNEKYLNKDKDKAGDSFGGKKSKL